MITVPALRVAQFGVEFYQAALSARDIERLVRFETLGYGQEPGPARGRKRPASRVNWELLETKISQSEAAYQRPVIQKKILELVQYYEQCRDESNLPSIPGAVIIASEKKLDFRTSGSNPSLGVLQIPEEEGVLRAIDGQHRLLALHAAASDFKATFEVPCVLFDSLSADQVVELFVTINAKHTRLNPSHLISLAGRRLYRDEDLAAAHDVVRALNEREDSPLYGEIRLLGVGRGRVPQAPLAEEIRAIFRDASTFGGKGKSAQFREEARRFYLNYFKQVARVLPAAWAGRKYSIKTGAALRAFLRVSRDVILRLREKKQELADSQAIGEVVAPWGERIGDGRFETEGEWRRKLAGGTRGTVEILARELRETLGR